MRKKIFLTFLFSVGPSRQALYTCTLMLFVVSPALTCFACFNENYAAVIKLCLRKDSVYFCQWGFELSVSI